MKKTNKKGFTIVELVIVIAVIAILAAVLIPNISRLVKKANESADIQACRQMNTALATEFPSKAPEDIEAVIRALAENGFNAEKTLVPITSGYRFIWHDGEKQLVLVDGENAVVFPENATYDESKAHDLASGAKLIPVTVENGEDILAAVQNGKKNVTLTSDIDLNANKLAINSDLTIDGNGHQIVSGTLAQGMSSVDRVFNVEATSDDITVTLKNLKIDESALERGISFYKNSGKIRLVIENCELTAQKYTVNVASSNSDIEVVIKNSTITGYCAFQTWSANTKVTFENCTLIGNNQWDNLDGRTDNDYSTVVVNTATNSELIFNNCTIEAKENSTENHAKQSFFSIGAIGTKIECHGCTFKKNGVAVDFDANSDEHVYHETTDYTLTID